MKYKFVFIWNTSLRLDEIQVCGYMKYKFFFCALNSYLSLVKIHPDIGILIKFSGSSMVFFFLLKYFIIGSVIFYEN